MEKTEIKKPTIQERIASRVNEILDPVEVWLDSCLLYTSDAADE